MPPPLFEFPRFQGAALTTNKTTKLGGGGRPGLHVCYCWFAGLVWSPLGLDSGFGWFAVSTRPVYTDAAAVPLQHAHRATNMKRDSRACFFRRPWFLIVVSGSQVGAYILSWLNYIEAGTRASMAGS